MTFLFFLNEKKKNVVEKFQYMNSSAWIQSYARHFLCATEIQADERDDFYALYNISNSYTSAY